MRPDRPSLRGVLARAGTVRVRTTAAAVLVVGIAIALGVGVLVQVLRGGLVDDLEASASRRAEELAAELERTGAVPPLTVSDAEEELVQIVAADGRVLAASGNVSASRAVVDPGEDDTRSLDVRVADEVEEFLVVVERTDVEAGRLRGGASPGQGVGGDEVAVLVGRSLDDVDDSASTIASLLGLAAPLLLGLVGFTTWWVVGRALAPVDRIRREVEGVTISEMHRRVPVPAGQDEIARLAETMNGMLARLEAGQARQRRFVADASHELRSPVASMRQHAEVAQAHPERVPDEPLADIVLAESTRLQHLIDDLLLLARADEGSLRPARRPVDLDDLVFEEARRLRDETALRIDTREVSAGRVLGDDAGLRRALRNLGDNAARHAAGTIAIRLDAVDGAVTLDVDDDGPGIPPGERDRVVDRFVRLDEARGRDAGGAGLGLAIVQELVSAHGGTLWIDDSPLGGARVTVRLPAADDG